jgi:hypothetical protein
MPPPLLFYGLSLLLTTFSAIADPGAGSALYPPGLQPLINRANALLSAGTFHDAAKAYSEAIGALKVETGGQPVWGSTGICNGTVALPRPSSTAVLAK